MVSQNVIPLRKSRRHKGDDPKAPIRAIQQANTGWGLCFMRKGKRRTRLTSG